MMEILLLIFVFFLPAKWKWVFVEKITLPFIKLREWAYGEYLFEVRRKETLYKKYGIEVI